MVTSQSPASHQPGNQLPSRWMVLQCFTPSLHQVGTLGSGLEGWMALEPLDISLPMHARVLSRT